MSINPIQLILVAALAGIFMMAMRGNISLLTRRFLAVIFFVAAILAVIFPNATTTIAAKLGVGRGADLLLYVSFVLFSYLILMLHRKIRKLEGDVTRLTRAIAPLPIKEPAPPIEHESLEG